MPPATAGWGGVRMKAWKWIVLGVVGVGTMAGGIVALVFWLTSGAVDAAENFLTLVGQGQYETAYRATAPDFRASNDFATFRTTMQRVRLDKFDSASWSSRHVRNNRAGVRGTAKLADG